MNTPEIFITFANILFLISSYPNIQAIKKSNFQIKGISLQGALLTTLGLLLMIISFLILEYYITILISVPTLLYWIIVDLSLLE